jgi:hypothetical protein
MTTPESVPGKLHYLITRHIIETGHAPDLSQLAALAGTSSEDAEQRLRQLEAMHGVILAPNSLKIWAFHPFSMTPTAHWVSTASAGWWANCAWCALGIGAALKEDVTVSTSDGGERQPFEFALDSAHVTHPGLLIHFPYPPSCWWTDNPYSPCANILFFSSHSKIDEWRRRHGHPQGSILDFATARQLANRWFGDYASPDWKRKTPEQAASIFSDLGLDPSFWKVPGGFR